MFSLILIAALTQDVPVAKAVITARDGGAAPSRHTSGALWLSARKSVYGKAPTSIEWEIEPQGLDDRSERGKFVEGDDTINPVICITYADYPVDGLHYDRDTNSYGFVVRLFTAMGDTQDRARVFVAVKGDLPPPTPTPPVPPSPTPTPVPPTPEPTPQPPVPVPGKISVLIIEDVPARPKLPRDQFEAMFAKSVRNYLDSHCQTGPDGKTPEWRRWHKDVDASAESAKWQGALAQFRAIDPQPTLPYILISNGVTGTSGPFPANEAATLELLRKWGGP